MLTVAAAQGGPAATPTTTSSTTPATRAGTTIYPNTFVGGDQFYATFPADAATVDATTYTLVAAQGSNTYNAATPLVQPYLRSGAVGADVQAYFPWRAGGQSPNASPTTASWTVAQDQTADAAYQASDLMYAEGSVQTDGTVKTAGQERLVFHHRMAKVIIKVTNNIGATIQAVNLVQGCRTVSIQTPSELVPGTALSDPIGQTTPLNVSTGAVPAGGVACLVPPQKILKDQRLIEVVSNMGTAYFALTTDQTLASGTEYTATVTLDRAAIGATTAVTAWTSGGDVTAERLPHEDFTVGGHTFRMVYVPAAAGVTVPAWNGNVSPQQSGQISVPSLSAYYIGQTKVTEALYNAVMGGTGGTMLPKYGLKGAEMLQFCNTLNQKTAGQRPEGYSFRLPSEAQWVYAATGGPYGHGYAWPGTNTESDAPLYCNYKGSQGTTDGPLPVASLHANELGLYDMGGNGWERCLDTWHAVTSAESGGADHVYTQNGIGIASNVCKSCAYAVYGVSYARSQSRMAIDEGADNHRSLRLALSRDVDRITVSYPQWATLDGYGPTDSYGPHDRFGLYVVDEAGRLAYSNLSVGLKAGSSGDLDLDELRRQGVALSPSARYFVYYPYTASPGTVTATGTTADAFFSGLTAAGAATALDQSTLDRLRSQDLQTGAGMPADGGNGHRTTVTIAMQHKRALAVVAMGASTTASHRYRVMDANTTTVKYSQAATAGEFYALDLFSAGTPQPYRVGRRNTAALRCYYIFKPAAGVTFQCAYSDGSTPQWASLATGTSTAAGNSVSLATGAPQFKNLGRVYTNTTPSTARSPLTGLENGAVQAYTLPFATDDCAYQIECWGAQGGNMVYTTYNGRGGLGGYVSGITTPKLDMQAGQNLYVYCGGCGIGWNSTTDNYGGWNGGGSCTAGASGGGGASDVRTVNAAWNDATGLHARLIVAGGGGGANDYRYSTSANDGEGGYGGKTGGSNRLTNGTTETESISGTYGKGATQTEAGALGSFGQGGQQTGTDGGCGGGGWYGGGKGGNNYMSGGGGSSYIRPGYFTNATYINGGTQNVPTTMPNPNAANGINMTSTYNDAAGGNGSRTNEYNWRGFVRITCQPYVKP